MTPESDRSVETRPRPFRLHPTSLPPLPVPEEEVRVVWNDAEWAAACPFVREKAVMTHRRVNSPVGRARARAGGMVVVGWSELSVTARRNAHGYYVRRLWYVHTNDLVIGGGYVHGGFAADAPVEGVLVSSVEPGVASVRAAPSLWDVPRPLPPARSP